MIPVSLTWSDTPFTEHDNFIISGEERQCESGVLLKHNNKTKNKTKILNLKSTSRKTVLIGIIHDDSIFFDPLTPKSD